MRHPIISIIVPVFNTAQYLARCIDSLLLQDFNDIEIVCINDGSTDDSLSILEQYEKLDPRIIIVSQKNAGLAAARNAGISVSKAPYIMFCDSDDWFEHKTCSTMLGALLKYNVDLAICGVSMIYDVPEELIMDENEYFRLRFSGREPVTLSLILQTNVSSCNKIFRRDIIDKYQISYPEGFLYEDSFFYDTYMSVSTSIFFVDSQLYNYYRHPNSIMSGTYRKTKSSIDHLYHAFRFYDFLHDRSIFPENSDYFWSRFLEYYEFAILHSNSANQRAVKKAAKRFLRTHKGDIYIAPLKIQNDILRMLYFRHWLRLGISWRLHELSLKSV